MIRSFKDKDTENIYNGIFSKKLPSNIQKIALRKLIMLNGSNSLNDLRIPPSNHLEKLSGDLKGYYSIRVNNQYRIIFTLDNNGGDVSEVQIIDYH
jgi:proteic killer suppression protein